MSTLYGGVRGTKFGLEFKFSKENFTVYTHYPKIKLVVYCKMTGGKILIVILVQHEEEDFRL